MTPTPQQAAAIASDHPRILVVAGAGSGKTDVIIARIRRLLADGCDPYDIAVVVYTNASARVISERIEGEILGFLGTLHAFCMQHLRDFCGWDAPVVLDDEEADNELLLRALMAGSKSKPGPLKKCRKNWLTERHLESPERIAVASYYHDMKLAGMLDYNSILIETADAFHQRAHSQRDWAHLIVDEFQDAAPIDVTIYLKAWATSLFLVGDSDQAIFNFRGGNVAGLIRLADDPEWEKHFFETNFRCAVAICEAAQALIEHNVGRVRKATIAYSPGNTGEVRVQKMAGNDTDEGLFIAMSLAERANHGESMDDFAVLARSNRIVDAIRGQLKQFDVPVREKGVKEYPEDWRLARAALNLICNPYSEAAFERYALIVNPERAPALIRQSHIEQKPIKNPFTLTGYWDLIEKELKILSVSKASIAIIKAKGDELPDTASLNDIAVALALEKHIEVEAGSGVTVTTVHGAKGREWPTVVFAGFEDEIIPGNRKNVDIEEERRVAFVGFTRARERLIITYAENRKQAWGRGKAVAATPSRFLLEAGL